MKWALSIYSKIVQVSAGLHFSAFCGDSGHVWVIGNRFIKKYFGGDRDADRPTDLKPFLLDDLVRNRIEIESISCGWDFVLMIQKDDGNVYGCGNNFDGQLGLGHTRDCQGTQLIVKLMDEGIVKISCGQGHAFAMNSPRKWWGWGDNVSTHLDKFLVDLGIGPFFDCVSLPTPLKPIPFLEEIYAASENTTILRDANFSIFDPLSIKLIFI